MDDFQKLRKSILSTDRWLNEEMRKATGQLAATRDKLKSYLFRIVLDEVAWSDVKEARRVKRKIDRLSAELYFAWKLHEIDRAED